MNGLVAHWLRDRGNVPVGADEKQNCRLSSPGWDAKSSEIGSSIGNPGSSDSPPLLY
jgi:hypothetical protein